MIEVATQKNEFTPARISDLAGSINGRLSESIKAIGKVNRDIHVLSINAKIQASKVGEGGQGFGVVADEIRKMVSRTQNITANLDQQVRKTVSELMHINEILQTRVRGQRLNQVALNGIDIVDRNLYERSCDVRWWATEEALVRALTDLKKENAEFASKRLGVILDSYTVYVDLVLCDLDGVVIANGRSAQFGSTGKKVDERLWFKEAITSEDGTHFGFEGVHSSELVNGQSILAYSCGIRKDGDVHGPLIGVLGILFNWSSLSEVVVNRAREMLSPETANPVSVLLCYPSGTVIASTTRSQIGAQLDLVGLEVFLKNGEDYQVLTSKNGENFLVGKALSKGFETYQTGWYALILEQLPKL